jgi:hypothetical protein
MNRYLGATLLSLSFGAPMAASAETVYVSTAGNQILSFDSAVPGTLLDTVNVTGLQGGEVLEGIDFRPTNGQLYGLGSSGRLYNLNRTTGAAIQIGAPFTLTGSRFGFDFNPTVDRIRVVSDQDQDLRLNPDTGALAATDPNLAFAVGDVNAGDNPVVAGAGYTNSLAGVTATTLYEIELGNDILVTQNPANNGTLNTIGPLGVSAIDSFVGFDISARSGTALAALNPGGGSALYRVDLPTGAALRIGTIGTGSAAITGLAIAPSAGTCVPSTTALCLSGDRFRVSVSYQLENGTTGPGQAIPLTSASGYFWFFSADNIELDVKVLDACSAFGKFWVFASGLTNVGVTINVVDTETGTTKIYSNPPGRAFQPVQDTDAFATCP